MQLPKMMQRIKYEIQNLDKGEKLYLLKSFMLLVNKIEPLLGLAEPFLLIIDNQILKDLSHINENKFDCKNRHSERLRAAFAI